MTRTAIYARFSTTLQNERSLDDQIRLCRERAMREGWLVTHTYTDLALSGASLHRPGLQDLIDAAQSGRVDVVLAEALDRISRDQADIAILFKQLAFHGVRIVTLAEGEINELHVGLKGTMNQLFLKDLAAKTRRGLRGRVEAGKSGGGLSYGYDVVRKLDADGAPVTGERTINASEATVIRRVFEAFASGESPKAIARALNAEGVAGPRGKLWRDTAIRGHRQRGTGLLNNELYIGQLVWNRMRYVKDPQTGKRVSRLNDPSEWIRRDVPELRIIDDTLWNAVKTRQGEIADDPRVQAIKQTRFWEKRRKTHLLTGLVFCGSCGGRYAAVGRDYLACSAARKLGTCTNRQSVRRAVLEDAVLHLLSHRLMEPDAVAAFIETYTTTANAQARSAAKDRSDLQTRRTQLQDKVDGLYDAIADGLRTPGLMSRLEALEAEIAEVEEKLAAPAPSPVLLHPNVSELYRKKVAALSASLSEPSIRTRALELIRSLIVRVTVRSGVEGLELELEGALSAMIGVAQNEESRPLAACSVEVVAGVGFEPTTFRL